MVDRTHQPAALRAYRAMMATETGDPAWNTMPDSTVLAAMDQDFHSTPYDDGFFAYVLEQCSPWLPTEG